MATVYLLGAGASHGYQDSPTVVSPPLAADFFETFFKLQIAQDLGTKIGWLINYVRDRYGIDPERFMNFRMNVEEFMTQLEDGISAYFEQRVGDPNLGTLEMVESQVKVAVYDQTLFLFTHVLNEITNGPVYDGYRRLIERLTPEDTVVTFNWDVLLDRALLDCSPWRPDDGYAVRFSSIFDEKWRLPERWRPNARVLLKLHGSTNWLTRYVSRNLQTGCRTMLQRESGLAALRFSVETDRTVDDVLKRGYPKFKPEFQLDLGIAANLNPASLQPLCFVKGERWFPTFKNRFRKGYGSLTYFYSPLDPNHGVATSPLIVAPVKNKGYEDFEGVLGPIWETAKQRIAQASRVCVIGFSFPPTDVRARSLFSRVKHQRTIEVVDPYPSRPRAALNELASDDVTVVASSLDEFMKSMPEHHTS
jgi:hypothetical protein